MIGFDCEWVTVNNERRKVALIQICSSEGLCGLFRVCKFANIPVELRDILENPEILKVGVTPETDARLLLQDYGINVQGTFDLRFIALQSGHQAGGLGALSKSILNITLDKNWRVRCSDWEIENLSENQIDYAAKDAFVAVEIFKKLYNEMNLPRNPLDIRRFGNNYSDISFKNKLAQLNLDSSSKKNVQGWSRKQKDIDALKKSISTRASPLYDNCRLQAPDGELLCACDQSKAEWYVKKGLGTVVEDESVYTVRLNFEPAGRAVADVGEYYCTDKENRCVVCGISKELLRKNVIPREYRKCFPQVMKDKTSHDIVLLCILCHQKSNIIDNIMRNKLKDICDAPLDGEQIEEKVDAAKVLKRNQRFANALLKGKNIPVDRLEQLRKDLKDSYPNEEINEEFLVDLIQRKPEDANLNSHGQIVVERYKKMEGLVALEKMWREVSLINFIIVKKIINNFFQHFLTFMNPKFMPNLWNVNHSADRLMIRASEGRITEEELKMAGIEIPIVEKKETTLNNTSNAINNPNLSNDTDHSSDQSNNSNNNYIEDDDDVDSSSDWESAYSYRVEMKNSTDDDKYFSDAASFYTLRSFQSDDTSTIADFKSFASSDNESTLYETDDDDDKTEKSFNDDGSETEVEDANTSVDTIK